MVVITDLKNKIMDVFPGKCARVVGRNLHIDGRPVIGGFNSDGRRTHLIPDQKLDVLRNESGEWHGTYPEDIPERYTQEEVEMLESKDIGAARAALKARGPATSETMPGLLERIVLIERILGV